MDYGLGWPEVGPVLTRLGQAWALKLVRLMGRILVK